LKTATGLEALLESLTDCARRVTSAERACVVLLAPDGTREIRVMSAAARPPDVGHAPQVSHTVLQRVLATRQPLILHDVFEDSELMGRPSVASLSLRSALCVPLTRGDRLYGAMYADSRAGAGSFDRVDLEILALFAEQASAAIETTRLLADVQRSYVDLKSTQEKLVRGERLRVMGELAGGVAHEFNNLLTSILARLQLLALDPLALSVRQDLGLIQKAALDAAEVVRRLQSFSRSQRQADFQRVDVAEICADVVEFLRPLSSSRRLAGKPPVALHLRVRRGIVVLGDPTELREVLTNLVKNAVEAIEGRGSVVLSASETAGVVSVVVEDDGPGIPAELQSRLFTPFFTTKGERGTGLGLCLSQQIAERHGGEIHLRPRSGGGTRAELVVPAAPPSSIGTLEQLVLSPTPTKRLSVLVVDDDPDVLEPLCDYLRRSGIGVQGALNPEDALARLLHHPPDVVLSDVSMPGMTGIELCRRAKAVFPNLPVVLMTGRTSFTDPTRATESGASALLSKPFTMRQVLDLIARLGERSPPGRG